MLEIARRLNVGRLLGRRWIVTRHAYLAWERKCGLDEAALGEGWGDKPI